MAALEDFSLFIRNGASIKQTDGAGGDPITRIETIANRTVNLTKCGYADISSEDYEKYILQQGDILISHINSTKHLGKCAIYEGNEVNVIHGMNLLCLRVDEKKAHPKYLFYMLSSSGFLRQLPKITKNSVNQSSFNVKSFQELQIPLPPLETQKQIAAVLEKADQLRKDCKLLEQALNSLAQSVFIEMFGDPVTNPKGWEIGIISDLLSSANYGTSEKSSTEILKYPVLRMNNLTYEGNWDLTSLKYMDMDEKDEEKYLVQNGDILFNRTNSKELVGKTAVYRENKPMAYAGYLVRARCNELGHPDYISSFMNSKYGKQTLQSMCKSIVGMANINAKEFQSINIAKPPIKLQLDFSIRIAKIRALIQEAKLQEAQYESAFNALMQKAFNGELKLGNAKPQ
jgi:type I restriction enzyme S subunit